MQKSGIKILSLLVLLMGISACSNTKIGLSGSKSGPQSLSKAYAPELTSAYQAYDEGRLSTAETLLLQYTKKHPGYTEAWFKLGNIYYRTGQYPAAITAYENVIQQQHSHGKAWYNLALTRIRQAEVTLEKGERQFDGGDPQRMRLTALKNKIRSGVRQYKPKKKKRPVAMKSAIKKKKTTKVSRYTK